MKIKIIFTALVIAASTLGCAGQKKNVHQAHQVHQEKPKTPEVRTWKPDGLPGLIADLEKLIKRPELEPTMRAQAMFRLAALEEDLAREKMEENGTYPLGKAIETYNEILRRYPDVDFIPSIHYFLGHALRDSGHVEEGQRVFLALVCHNHFVYSPPADAETPLPPMRLVQDHEPKFWFDWERRHPLPIDKSPLRALGIAGDEMTFVNPYPADCAALEQKTQPGQAPRFIGEVWWRIGDYHFDQIDQFGGPYNLNRAVVAYQFAIRHGSPLIRLLGLYKLAWTFFKQQRYAAAVDQFVELYHYADVHQARTGDSGADFRKEAATYIAASLTYVDFQGPRLDDPYIPRDDVLDTEKDPLIAEKKMHVAIDRVRDPKVIPQDEKWTRDIYEALILEFHELNQPRNEIEMRELFLSKWPGDSRADEIRKGLDKVRSQLAKP